MWEVLGLDVFEVEHVVEKVAMKSKFLVMVDRGSRFTLVSLLKTFKADEAWEPSTMDIKRMIVRTWLGANPSPKWFFTDSAAYISQAAKWWSLHRIVESGYLLPLLKPTGCLVLKNGLFRF